MELEETGTLILSKEDSIIENNGVFVPILINEILGTRKRVECRIFEGGVYTQFQEE